MCVVCLFIPVFKTSWETVGKKKPLVKEAPSESKENKENREKKGEREASKARAAANRKGKGGNRSRQGTEMLACQMRFFLLFERLITWYRWPWANVVLLLCSFLARPEENGVEVTPVEKGSEKGSERGRRQRGGRGEQTLLLKLSPALSTRMWVCVWGGKSCTHQQYFKIFFFTSNRMLSSDVKLHTKPRVLS